MIKAEYIDHMGSDLMVVNSARVSFGKESEFGDNGELVHKDGRLLAYLAKHNHWTPYSHPQITMRETVPIFVSRQRFKHMVGFSYNEVSRRYVDDAPEFYRPRNWRARPDDSIKQGSGLDMPYDMQWGLDEDYNEAVAACERVYKDFLAKGVAPEQARMVLPQSMLTQYYVTGSLAAWARAYKQRIDSTAQVEIQDLAKQWGDIIEPLFPKSWTALTE